MNASALLRKYRGEDLSGIRCLSVRQPWASLIASGVKTIELRTWRTNYRGPLIVCSAVGGDPRLCHKHGDGPRGFALCVVNVVDCRRAVHGDTRRSVFPAGPEHYAWILADARPIEPTLIVGRLSFFEPTTAVREAVAHAF